MKPDFPFLTPLIAAFAGFALLPANASITNRWSFNNANGAAATGTVITDSVGGQNAFVRGVGANFASGALTLPGTTSGNQTPAAISAYIDLPNGLVSSKNNFTLEIWATPVSNRNWQRLMDFGRTDLNGNAAAQGAGAAPGEILHTATVAPGGTASSDNLMLAINRGTDANTQRMVGRINGAPEIGSNTGLTLTATQHHFVVIFTDVAGSSGGQIAWYLNGALAAATDVNFKLSAIEDVNNWLGRSQYSGDSNSNVSYNEVRLYDHAFTAAEVIASRNLGPNPTAPSGVADSITMHHGQKAAIAVLANDIGGMGAVMEQAPQFGTAVVDSYNRIRYSHTTGTPTSDTFTYRATNLGGQSAPVTVTVDFSQDLRLANNSLNVPSTPPPTAYQIVDAFGALAFADPTCLATPPGETQRLFVCQKAGLLRMVPDVTAASPTASTFLDLPSVLSTRSESLNAGTNSEQGLLGLAFHPEYADNGYFFVFYSVRKAGLDYQRVSRFQVESENPNSADPESELILIEQRDQASNHNGGDLHFGPLDKYLYISLGDEGDQNDGLSNSQRITKDFFSGILRIDVDKKPGNLEPNAHPNPNQSDPVINAVMRYETAPESGVFLAAYSIPFDNPFVAETAGGPWNGSFNGTAITAQHLPYVRSEFWAVGLRNPWRISFDIPVGNPPVAELWTGDVGGGAREEIDVIQKGGNYGWSFREGFIARPGSPTPPAGFSSLPPVYDYRRIGDGSVSSDFQGNSVTGGFVYRGTRFNSLVGAYVFADHISGNVWSLRRNGTNPPTVERIAGEGGIAAFGKDPSNGDVLMANLSNDRIRRLIGGTPSGTYPTTLGATGLFADLTDLSPNPGLLPYQVNLPFWSDHALKRRWFVIPGLAPKMTWSDEGSWTFPTGQIWVKHFDLPLSRSNPPLPTDPPTPSKRIETRVLVKNASGSYGVSYRWNDAGTEATLVPDEGADFDIPITRGGSPYNQRWRIPSRAECSICHTPQAGHALSMNTRQFNLANTINGFSGNQLDLLESGQYFSNSVNSPNVLPYHVTADDTDFPVEARVRSYLAVNCAYCHQAGGTAAPSAWDGRIELHLDQTGLINGTATNNGGDPANKLVIPGDIAHSVLLNRVAAANGFTRMPPLGSNELDLANIDLLTEWIGQTLPAKQTYQQWRQQEFLSPDSPEGEPGFDADGDGRTNNEEFLAATDPLDGAGFFGVTPGWNGGQFKLDFQVPANRSVRAEISSDLLDWTFWDVPGNHGLPRPGGSVTLQGPATDSNNFFRLKLNDN